MGKIGNDVKSSTDAADYREIVLGLRDAVFVIDGNGIIRLANPAAYQLFGLLSEELIGKPFGLPFSGKETTRVSIRRRGDGRTIQVEMKVAVIEEQGEKKYITSLRDISSILETEELRSQARVQEKVKEILTRDKDDFERQVRERTGQLIKSQEQLEKASRLSSVGVLAATIAHELRNPLAAIKMAAYSIKQKKDQPPDKQLETINKKIEESDEIISNLLSYSRLKQPHFEPLDIGPLIEETAELTASRFSQKQVRVKKDLRELNEIRIVADGLQLKQVFSNILNNAFDAVKDKAGEIDIIAGRQDNDRIEILISDNGPGIDQDALARVFEPFFTTKSKGTGLGLSVTRDIITMHQGEIGVTSEKDKGTRFIVRLPLKQQ